MGTGRGDVVLVLRQRQDAMGGVVTQKGGEVNIKSLISGSSSAPDGLDILVIAYFRIFRNDSTIKGFSAGNDDLVVEFR